MKAKTTPLDEQLKSAAGAGKTADCLDLLRRGAKIDYPGDDLVSTALHRAARGGHLETCIALLDAGANAAVEDGLAGLIAVQSAAASVSPRALATTLGLLAYPGMPQKNQYGRHPLHAAVQSGTIETVQGLLDFGVDVNTVNQYGWTALHEAIQFRKTAAIQLLLKRGADVHAISASGLAPVHTVKCVESLVECISSGIDIEVQGVRGLRLIHHACSLAQTSLVQALVAVGANTDHCYAFVKAVGECFHKSPFVNAIQCGNAEIMGLHLARFGAPSKEELKKSKRALTKNSEMSAVLNAHLARVAIENVLKASPPKANPCLVV